MQVLDTRAKDIALTPTTTEVSLEKKATIETAPPDPERAFDAAFERLPEQRAPTAAPELTLDVALISDLVNRRTTENARETRRTREVLKATDKEIAAAAEASRQEHEQIQASLLARSVRAHATASVEAEGRKAAEAGIAPLASSVAPTSSAPLRAAARRNARLGLQANQLEARLAQKLNDAMV